MQAMSYFRRPQLVGKFRKRNANGTVRGDLRRNDADITSAVPYFPGVTSGMQLLLTIDGTPYTVTFANDGSGVATGYQNILNIINAAITGHGQASDSFGSLVISTLTVGGLGSVLITGGTAAALIGLDVTGRNLYGVGGDIPSSPEGGVMNPYGATFPSTTENLSSEQIHRDTASIAANVDVLYADMVRNDAKMVNLGTVAAASQTAIQTGYSYLPLTGTVLGLGSSPAVYTGLGLLSRTSVATDLAPFFIFIDTATKQPAISRVVAIVNGNPSGLPPYADTASWGANDGGNVLGKDLIKATGTITGVRDGRMVTCSGTTFTTTVLPGDYAEVVGATNTNEWNNNGYRWVVEKVVSNTQLLVRPMSLSELALVGTSPADNQPVLELSEVLTAGQAYGTLNVHNGPFSQGCTAVLSPPLPTGASYQLWAAIPSNFRGTEPSDRGETLVPYARDLVRSVAPSPDEVVSGIVFSGSGTSLTISSGVVRWKGRIYNLAASSVAAASFGTTGTWYAFFDSTLGVVNYTQSFSSVFGAAPVGVYLATLDSVSGTNVTITDTNKPSMFGAAVPSYTVGVGGDFPDLNTAIAFLNNVTANSGETLSASGVFSHAELVLVSDITVTSSITVTAPGLVIRGATQNIKLLGPSSGTTFDVNTSSFFTLDTLSLGANVTSAGAPFITATGNGNKVYVRNCVSQGGTANYIYFFNTGSTFSSELHIEDSSFSLVNGLVAGPISKVSVQNSVIAHVAQSGTSTVNQIISSSSAGASATASSISMVDFRNAQFTNWTTTSSSIPFYFINSNATGNVFIRDTFLSAGVSGGVVCPAIEVQTGRFFMSGSIMGTLASPFSQALVMTNTAVSSFVTDSIFFIKNNVSVPGVQVLNIEDCIINGIDSTTGNTNFSALVVGGSANGNTVTGVFSQGIAADSNITTAVAINGNIITLSAGSFTTTCTSGILFNGVGGEASNNYVSTFSTAAGILVDVGTVLINGNQVMVNAGQSGLSITSGSAQVNGNWISYVGSTGSRIALAAVSATVFFTGNTVALSNDTNSTAISLDTAGFVGAFVTAIGNNITAGKLTVYVSPGQMASFIGNTITSATSAICNNAFNSNYVLGNVTLTNDNFNIVATGNTIFGNLALSPLSTLSTMVTSNIVTGTLTVSGITSGSLSGNNYLTVRDCQFGGNVSLGSGAYTIFVIFDGNIVNGTFSGSSSATPGTFNYNVSNNEITGNTTAAGCMNFDGNSVGGRCIVSAGTFNGNNLLGLSGVSAGSPHSILGSGAGSTIVGATALISVQMSDTTFSPVVAGTDTVIMQNSQLSNCESSMVIQDSTSGSSFNYLTSCYIYPPGSSTTGLGISHTSEVIVTGCDIQAVTGTGATLSMSMMGCNVKANVTLTSYVGLCIDDCTIGGATALTCDSSFGTVADVNCTVSDCVLAENLTISSAVGLVSVADNESPSGAFAITGSGASTNITVSGNLVVQLTVTGNLSAEFVINGNNIGTGGLTTIGVGVISNNQIYDGGIACHPYSSSFTVQLLVVSGNLVYWDGTGSLPIVDIVFPNVSVVGNTFAGPATVSGPASGTVTGTVSGNNFAGGLTLYEAKFLSCTGNLITNNASSPGFAALTISENMTDCVIDSNYIYNANPFGGGHSSPAISFDSFTGPCRRVSITNNVMGCSADSGAAGTVNVVTAVSATGGPVLFGGNQLFLVTTSSATLGIDVPGSGWYYPADPTTTAGSMFGGVTSTVTSL